jgi:capsular exopolysaccharide synthesis family protein
MSRMQNILEKAEREGSLRRMHADVSTATAALDLTPSRPPAAIVVDPPAGMVSAALPAGVVPGAAPVRVIADATLDPRIVRALASDAATAEQYRAVRTRILHADNGVAAHLILITSARRGEGKTLTTANLALTMAQDFQRRICVVDADLRTPQLHRMFGVGEAPGLSDVLSGKCALEDALVTIEEHGLTVLPAGRAPAHPAELLGTMAMRRTLDALRGQFDRVVVDAPPATPLADVGILTPLVDSVVLVVRAGVTPKPTVHEAIAALDRGKLLGVVLNAAA